MPLCFSSFVIHLAQMAITIAIITNQKEDIGELLGIAFLMPVAPRIDLEISVGRSDSDFFEPNTWGGLGILIYGGN